MKKILFISLILSLTTTILYSQTYESLFYEKKVDKSAENREMKIKIHPKEQGKINFGGGIGGANNFTQLGFNIYLYKSFPTEVGWYVSTSGCLDNERSKDYSGIVGKNGVYGDELIETTQKIINFNAGIAWKFFTCAIGLGSNSPYYIYKDESNILSNNGRYGVDGESTLKLNFEGGFVFPFENKKSAFHLTYSTNGSILTAGLVFSFS